MGSRIPHAALAVERSWRGWRLLTCVVVVSAGSLACAAAPADAALKQVTVRQGPFTLSPYEVRFGSGRDRRVRAPGLGGYIVRMHARLVDRRGRPMPVQRIMLHHIVYKNLGRFRGDRYEGACRGDAESFYGTGEEDATLSFPPGYGYRVRRGDRWTTGWMLMNHSNRADRAYIEYTAVIETSSRLTAVDPFWLRVTKCESARDPIFTVPGGGAPGSSYVKSILWTVPYSGRLIAANSHVHGGAKSMVLSQPACGERPLFVSKPLFGLPSHPYYHVLPVLHEPGPIATSWAQSERGIPVTQGEELRLTSYYDGELPHMRVMAIMHLYLARDDKAHSSCGPLPKDVREIQAPLPGRSEPPPMTVPLTGLGRGGSAFTILRPPGRTFSFSGNRGPNVRVAATSFDMRNLSIPVGGLVRWHFRDPNYHNVTLANGPVGFAGPLRRRGQTYTRQFTTPGTYRVFCSLHPIDMTQTIVVRKR